MVKTNRISGKEGVEACIDSLAKTYDDIETKKAANQLGQAVIIKSWGYFYGKADEYAPWRDAVVAALIELIQQLTKLNVVCVALARNGSPVSQPGSFP